MKNFNEWKIIPEGWMREQLLIQARGLSGNLDKVWPDVRDSAWIGGEREGWERVPYWLDGFIPLAYLLGDGDMKARADRYISAIISGQQEDGWICPCSLEARAGYDLWAHFLISKVLTLYCSFTGSEQAKTALYRATKCLHASLIRGEVRLFEWGEYRWFEELIAIDFLLGEYGDEWLRDLARLLAEQGADYPSFTDRWKVPEKKWTFETHIVNLAMMFKYEVLTAHILGEEYKNKAEELWQVLETYNGTAVGTFTGDECLAGTANNQGTELCAVVELMYSLEVLAELTGDPRWLDRLERIAYNALPATLSDDMWTHQYDQQVNQIAAVRTDPPIWLTNGPESNLFGLEPNYGCCTANFNQGWPKLAAFSFTERDGGVFCPILQPSRLECEIGGTKISIREETEYPHRLTAKFTVTAEGEADFPLWLHVPDWVRGIGVRGSEAAKAEIAKDGTLLLGEHWSGESAIEVEFFDTPRLTSRPSGLFVAEYGPLVFALPIEYEAKMYEYVRDGVERRFPYCDYELLPKSEWRYGFSDGELSAEQHLGDGIPFSSKSPKITLKAKLAPVDWDFAEGFPEAVSAAVPKDTRALGEATEAVLYPYGSAKLRMTEMPIITKQI